MKKIVIHSEVAFLLATILLALGVVFAIASDFGVSMLAAPSLLLSMKFTFLTTGQWEYVLQAVLFIVFCIAMKQFRITYLQSFLSGVFYGIVLDLWRLIPIFRPENVGTASIALRIIFFLLGMLLTSFSVALYFKSYLCPQVTDFFVKGLAERYSLNQTKFKVGFDITYFVVSVLLSYFLFQGIKGIGIGTVIITALNGLLIGFFSKQLNLHTEVKPIFPKLQQFYEGKNNSKQ